jgi:hypothetical protein
MALIGLLRARPLAAPARKLLRVDAFTLFYLSHLFFYAYIVLLLLHAHSWWKWVVGPGSVWVADRLYLLFAHSYATRLERVELLPGRVTKLVVRAPKRFRFHAGEYAFIKVPGLSGVEWHPFTISSSALRAERFTLHVRSLGNWTTALYDSYEARARALDGVSADVDVNAAVAAAAAPPAKLRLPRTLVVDDACEIRGPFGALACSGRCATCAHTPPLLTLNATRCLAPRRRAHDHGAGRQVARHPGRGGHRRDAHRRHSEDAAGPPRGHGGCGRGARAERKWQCRWRCGSRGRGTGGSGGAAGGMRR